MLFYSAILLIFIGIGSLNFIIKDAISSPSINKNSTFFYLVFTRCIKKDTVGYDSITYHNWYNLLSNGEKPTGSYPNIKPDLDFNGVFRFN